MNRYKCLKNNIFKKKDFSLVPLRKEDIFKIMKWRNEQINILRQDKELTEKDQLMYYNHIIRPLFDNNQPPQILFSYLKADKCIGYGGMVYVNWIHKRSEISFLVDTDRTKTDEVYFEDFGIYIKLIKKIAFEELNFNRLYTETFNLDERIKLVEILEEVNFKKEGNLKKHSFINGEYVDSILHGLINDQKEDR